MQSFAPFRKYPTETIAQMNGRKKYILMKVINLQSHGHTKRLHSRRRMGCVKYLIYVFPLLINQQTVENAKKTRHTRSAVCTCLKYSFV